MEKSQNKFNEQYRTCGLTVHGVIFLLTAIIFSISNYNLFASLFALSSNLEQMYLNRCVYLEPVLLLKLPCPLNVYHPFVRQLTRMSSMISRIENIQL